MSLVIELPPEAEKQLLEEAARSGLAASDFARDVLLRSLRCSTSSPATPQAREAELIEAVNEGFAPPAWERYHKLLAKRRAEELSSAEQAELISMSDQIEAANVRRMEHLAELARLRSVPLTELMDQLGIKPPPYG